MIQLDKTWFPQIYNIMKEAFPIEERRVAEEQLALFELPHYQAYGMVQDDQLIAFLAVWEFDNLIFGEHLASVPWVRGSGVGKELLLEYVETIEKPLILEVEPPYNGIAARRIKFYERLGFHLYDHLPYRQPSFHQQEPLPLHLMCSLEDVSDETLKSYINILYHRVYQEEAPWT